MNASPDAEGGVQLGADAAQSVRLISRLRNSLESGRAMRWRGGVVPPLTVDLVCHLPPPGRDDDLSEWRARFAPGLCYYRRGPGFIQVKDSRVPDATAGFVIDDRQLLTVFARCETPVRLPSLSLAHRQAVEVLAEENLVLVLDDWAVTLPHRMKRWPIPAPDV